MIESYKDLTLGAFMRLQAIPDDIEPLDRQVAILAALSGCTDDDILRLPLDEYSRRVAASRFLEADLPQRLPQRSYTVGEFTLVPVQDFKHMTTAQFVDFKTFTDSAAGDDRALANLTAELLSCMMVPKGRDYCDGYDPLEVQAALRGHLRADDAVALSAFFLAKWMRWSRRILISSRRAARRAGRTDLLETIRTLGRSRKALTSTRRSGDGSRSSTR